MRYRIQSTTVPSSASTYTDLKNGGTYPGAVNGSFIDSESLMWDSAEGSRKANKAVLHLKYIVSSYQSLSRYNGADSSNAPNPRTRYDNVRTIAHTNLRPSADKALAGSYIPVTGYSTDDLGKCVFDAYNKFVNGITALSADVSIAEAGETPKLFDIWQRRLSAPTNIVNGFLNYSFGWRPVLSDLIAISRELRTFPKTVRKRLKAIGNGEVVRHFKFSLDNTVNDLNTVHSSGPATPYWWSAYERSTRTRSKSRTVVVTIRANVAPKLNGDGQALLNKLGAAGVIPSLGTLWSITRLSFVIDWFYNIGGAIENLQGSLTHNISNVRVCVSDLRSRVLETKIEDTSASAVVSAVISQRYYSRETAVVPTLPVLSYPRRVMPYVLLGALGLTQTKLGRKILAKGPKLNVDLNLNALRDRLLRDKKFRKKVLGV